ncbi:MAG: FtsX-like permease family protein [Proteobacteria bacterium]|nr:FtsX-like permease family protein [Pseudomonadota bacterium]
MSVPLSSCRKIALRNVVRNWRRSLASSLAIAAGFTAISLFDGFLKDLKFVQEDGFSSRGMLGEVVIQRHDAQYKLIEDTFAYALTKEEQEFLDSLILKDPDVDVRVRFMEIKGMISNGQNNAVFIGTAMDVQEGRKMRGPTWEWNVLAGKPLYLAQDDNVILTGMGLGLMMDCKPNADVMHVTKRGGGYIAEDRPFTCVRPRLQLSSSTEAAQVNALDLTVFGLLDHGFREADQHYVQMPLSTAQRLLDTDKVTLISVRMLPGKDQTAFINRIAEASKAKGYNFDVMPWREHSIGNFIRSTNSILGTFRGIFMTIVVIIVVLSVANTMVKSVNERIREIGTLRSMGFHQKDVRTIFTLEGVGLAALSCLSGIIVTLIICLAVNYSGIRYKAGMLSVPIFLTVGINPLIWIVNTVWLTTLAALTAWFSSRKAAKMVVADALRYS